MIRRLLPWLLLAVLPLTSCGTDVAASVSGSDVTEDALRRELDAIGDNVAYMAHLSRGVKSPARDEEGRLNPGLVAGVLTRQIRYLAAKGVARDERVSVDDAPRDVARRDAIEEVGGHGIFAGFPAWYQDELVRRQAVLVALRLAAVRGEEARTYYESHRDEFIKPCTRHLVVETREQVDDARRRIAAGEAFSAVAEEVSRDDTTDHKGGDLGCNGVGDLVAELDRASLAQPVGEVGRSIKTEAGWHLLLVYRRTTPPFADVRGEVDIAIVRLAERRVGAALARKLADGVDVAGRYGRWDDQDGKVVAP